MLVLSRKKSQSVIIDGLVAVTVVGFHNDKVRLGFTGPREVEVMRDELVLRRCEEAGTEPPPIMRGLPIWQSIREESGE